MGRRVGQLAGIFTFVLMMARLQRLLLSGDEEPQWLLILPAAAFLGGVAWWLLAQMTRVLWVRIAIFAVAGALIVFRITAPGTAWWGVVPTEETFAVMGPQFVEAFSVLRSGIAPVAAEAGILAILALVMWVMGALFIWGSTGGPYAAMFLPPLIMYFQFAVFDRAQVWVGWLALSGCALALAAVSLALERREETGRARDEDGRPMRRRSMALAGIMASVLAVGSIVVAGNASAVVDEYGNAPWRGSGSGGYGSGSGGFTYDRLVDLQQSVVSQSNRPVFEATFSSDGPRGEDVYWVMEHLDSFDGANWTRSNSTPTRYQAGEPVAGEWDVYQGTRTDFVQNVFIVGLRQDVAPTAGVPVAVLAPPPAENPREPEDFSILNDAALHVETFVSEGDAYSVQTVQADLDADLGMLATGEDGELTSLFRQASADGLFDHDPAQPTESAVRPPDFDRYVTLPDGLPAGIRQLAGAVTAGSESDFERAWRLEAFFREPGNFEYNAELSTGHSSLDLDNWLNDSTSLNYRTGYCEQFSAAMAVMARSLEIPTRVVWGFTPGEVQLQPDGSQRVLVRARNAHAWVEIWLDQVGWVRFDPTPRSDQTDFTDQPASITAGFDPDDYAPEATENNELISPDAISNFGGELDFADEPPLAGGALNPNWMWLWLLALIPLALSVPIFKRLRRSRRLARIREGDITAAWDEIVDRLTDLGEPVPESMTPIELAWTTDDALLPLAKSYAATVYGGRIGQARDSDLYGVEWWIDRTYDAPRRARAAMSLRSIFRRDR